jgi:hypothetical protein
MEPKIGLRQFSGRNSPPPHALLAHVYGIKNLYTGAIRLYAAYHITNGPLYDLATFTFIGVLILYISEAFIYRHSRVGESFIPYTMAGGGLLWAIQQRAYYVTY